MRVSVDEYSIFRKPARLIELILFHLQISINLISFLLNNLLNNFQLKSVNLIVCCWDSINFSATITGSLTFIFLRFRISISLLNFRDKQIISLIVKISFLILLKQMIILKDQLCKLFIHHSFLLTLNIFKSVWNNCY